MTEFKCKISGSKNTFTLYDGKGVLVYDMDEAIKIADRIYGDHWTHVFNDTESIEREDGLY